LPIKKVLFLCGRNRLRSPTAEAMFSTRHDIEVESAGLDHDSDTPCTPELVAWADIVFVMEKSHKQKLSRRFRPYLRNAKVVCLDIADDYAFMQPELVRLLQARVGRHLP
jgi:predicted protein tyrosine phosphatase